MSGKQMNIEELLKICKCTGEIGSLVWSAIEDGKVNFGDIDEAWGIIKLAKDLTDVDYKKAIIEWKDLDDGERKYLVDNFRDSFEGPLEDVEQFVEDLVAIAVDLYTLIQNILRNIQTKWSMG